jgi:hypothetical protein
LQSLIAVRVALVTSIASPHLRDDDANLVSVFASEGIETSIARWNDETVDWSSFDALLLRIDAVETKTTYRSEDLGLHLRCIETPAVDVDFFFRHTHGAEQRLARAVMDTLRRV